MVAISIAMLWVWQACEEGLMGVREEVGYRAALASKNQPWIIILVTGSLSLCRTGVSQIKPARFSKLRKAQNENIARILKIWYTLILILRNNKTNQTCIMHHVFILQLLFETIYLWTYRKVTKKVEHLCFYLYWHVLLKLNYNNLSTIFFSRVCWSRQTWPAAVSRCVRRPCWHGGRCWHRNGSTGGRSRCCHTCYTLKYGRVNAEMTILFEVTVDSQLLFIYV